MTNMFAARLVIEGQDKTDAAFREIQKKIGVIGQRVGEVSRNMSVLGGSGWETMNRDMSVLGGRWKNIASTVGEVSMHIERAGDGVGRLSQAMRGLGGVAKSVGGIMAGSLGFAAVGDLGKGIKASADYAGQLAHLKYAVNVTPAELAFAENKAAMLPAQYTNQSSAEIIKSYGEARAAITNRADLPKIFDAAIALKSALETEGKELNTEDFRASVKALEIAGYSDNPARFKAFSEGFVKGRQIEGSLMTPENVLAFMQNASSAARALSPRFLRDVMPSLIGEQGGPKSGAAMNQIYKTNLGQGLAHAPDAVAQLLALGLLNKGDVAYNKQGNPSGLKPGHSIKDAALAISDPDIWMQKDLMPAMDRLHYNELQKKAAFARIYKGKTGPGEVEMLDTQRELFKQHAANIEEAGGEDAAAKVRAADPAKAMADFATSFDNAITALTSPAMQAFAPVAEDFSKAIDSLVPSIKAFAEAHPVTAAGAEAVAAGAGAWGIWRGAQAILPGLFGGGTATAVGGAAAAGGIGGGIALPALAAGAAAVGAAAALNSLVPQQHGALGRFGEYENAGGSPYWRAIEAEKLKHSLPMFASGAVPGAGLNLSPSQVTAKLDGQAQITVILDASPELLRLMNISSTISAIGDVAPVGTSMPEASPDQGGRLGTSR